MTNERTWKRAWTAALLASLLGAALPVAAESARPLPPSFAATASRLRGVNVAGAEFGTTGGHGIYAKDYIYPDAASLRYYREKGMNVVRLPVRWERLQHAPFASLDALDLAHTDRTIAAANRLGLSVVLDVHNYARYGDGVVGGRQLPCAALVSLWSGLATHYVDNPLVLFGLMNEPHSMRTEVWRDCVNEVIAAIRRTGARHTILVPGNGWTGAHSWSQSFYGTPNAVAMLDVVDPANNFAFEVHQYLDADASGESENCVHPKVGSERLAAFTAWLRRHGKRAFLAEFGAGRGATCLAALDDMLAHVEGAADVWLGWSCWGGGPWWGDYPLAIEPAGGHDRPQMAVLARYLESNHDAGRSKAIAPIPGSSKTTVPRRFFY